jgi:phosphomannomutase
MTLISSVSGIRGTIGGVAKENLTPVDVVVFAAAYGSWLRDTYSKSCCVVVGRDARISGPMVQALVQQTLVGLGIDVIDVGLSTTPTIEMEVVRQKAQGGIILTASHNPKEWNALKLLNAKGEFISKQDGVDLMQHVHKQNFDFALVDNLGSISQSTDALDAHIDAILALPLVDASAIRNANIHAVVDGVNSSGGVAVPALLKKLGVKTTKIHCTPNGEFPHNPEPLKEHLTDLSQAVSGSDAVLGIAVDPDVDRLVFVDESGLLFGEEYTLIACADYVLQHNKGAVVSNLSSSRALADLANDYGVDYHASAVGEVHVVEKMKAVDAVIGGEGNGGIIYPELHYGRDALVGIALFLSFLALEKTSISSLKRRYTSYVMLKDRVVLSPDLDIDGLLRHVSSFFAAVRVTTIDGVKIDFEDAWIHLRKSNTEPIIRLYAEGKTSAIVAEKKRKLEEAIAAFGASA